VSNGGRVAQSGTLQLSHQQKTVSSKLPENFLQAAVDGANLSRPLADLREVASPFCLAALLPLG
jgi:hypothetical protein